MAKMSMPVGEWHSSTDLESWILCPYRFDRWWHQLLEAQAVLRREWIREPQRLNGLNKCRENVAVECVVVIAVRSDRVLRAECCGR